MDADHQDLLRTLPEGSVVIIGNGNVALDVARILTMDPDRLTDTDIAPHALKALRDSRIEEAIVVGRRGVAPALDMLALDEPKGCLAAAQTVRSSRTGKGVT